MRRGRQFVTTRPDPAALRAPDHVQRRFRATRPNELWVVDSTYVATWSGMEFTAFVTDVYSRRIVGWRTMARMPTDLPLDALEMASGVRDRAGHDVTGVIQHSDSGTQYTALRCESASHREPRDGMTRPARNPGRFTRRGCALWHRKWTAALLRHIVYGTVEGNTANAEVVSGWMEKWTPLASEALKSLAGVTAEAPVPSDPSAVAARIADEVSAELSAALER